MSRQVQPQPKAEMDALDDIREQLKRHKEAGEKLIAERNRRILAAKLASADIVHIAKHVGVDRSNIYPILKAQGYQVNEERPAPKTAARKSAAATGKPRGWNR
ncbi:hypothetical protein M8C13_06175 [Crossiella sp. SN42]|uniref:hypothetical protein n=1 Tax=Crossiella sp. SN42 TaxID=2944808 RepID=UPI00207C7B7C|nr:hypothetical protein [Crossiella sp. SN42]MCO1575346.1 hypothetical protein [Crossiella sp. SN42]